MIPSWAAPFPWGRAQVDFLDGSEGAVAQRPAPCVLFRSHRTNLRPAQSWLRSGGRSCGRAWKHVDWESYRSSRCARTPRIGADEATTRHVPNTPHIRPRWALMPDQYRDVLSS